MDEKIDTKLPLIGEKKQMKQNEWKLHNTYLEVIEYNQETIENITLHGTS